MSAATGWLPPFFTRMRIEMLQCATFIFIAFRVNRKAPINSNRSAIKNIVIFYCGMRDKYKRPALEKYYIFLMPNSGKKKRLSHYYKTASFRFAQKRIRVNLGLAWHFFSATQWFYL